MRIYHSKHADEECECCSERPKKCAIRFKWVGWNDFIDNYPLFRYEHKAAHLNNSNSNVIALRRSGAFQERAKAWYRGVKSGPVPTQEQANSFDRSDYDFIALGYFPYDMDMVSATKAWDDEFGN